MRLIETAKRELILIVHIPQRFILKITNYQISLLKGDFLISCILLYQLRKINNNLFEEVTGLTILKSGNAGCQSVKSKAAANPSYGYR